MDGRVAVMKLPIPSCPWLQLSEHPSGFRKEMFRLNAKFVADSLLYSLILNTTATQYNAHSTVSTHLTTD